MVEADLASEYGVDVDDREMMRKRSWRSLRTLIVGLCSADTRLGRALRPDDDSSTRSGAAGKAKQNATYDD